MYLYAGGLGEMWNWPAENVSEVVNDLNGYLTNFYRVLQVPKSFAEMKRRLEATPFSRVEWSDADATMKRLIEKTKPEEFDPKKPDPLLAALFFVWNRQSMAGRMANFSPLSKLRTRGGRNAEANAWWSSIDGLEVVRDRIDGVAIEHLEAVQVGKKEDKKDTLFYADPTYFLSAEKGQGRTTADVYDVETSDAQHRTLIEWLEGGIKGKMMLSGYANPLYDKALTKKKGWRRIEKVIDNKAQKGAIKRQMLEVLWLNY